MSERFRLREPRPVDSSSGRPEQRRGARPLAASLAAALIAAASPLVAQRAPAPVAVNLPPDVVQLACAPGLTYEAPPTPLRVTGGQESAVRLNFVPGDLITINAGSDNGIAVGQQYYTRRAVPLDVTRAIRRDNPGTIHTSGWIRIYAIDARMSLATIVHACDVVRLNDYLEPFVLPTPPVTSTDRPVAQRGNYGHVVAGHDNRTAFGKDDLFLVDRGSDHGVTVGAHFVVYRDHQRQGNFLFELGEAVAVNVTPESSTLRVTLSRDAFLAGDYVALRK